MVKRTWFDPAVSIIGKRGKKRAVNSVEAAVDSLMSASWPVHGPKRERAAEVMIYALIGNATPGEARLAFIEAAREAGILVAQRNRELQ